ncbi:MAG: DUF1003 domain-containing protein [Pirellulaceae bacterium]
MTEDLDGRSACAVCGQKFPLRELVQGSAVHDRVGELIAKENPRWTSDSLICRIDLNRYRGAYVQELLSSEKGEITVLESEVLDSLRKHEILAANIDSEFQQKWSLGERMADKIASFGGSWYFLLAFAALMVVWIVVNSFLLISRAFDPFPFILLNLILSCLAAVQAPVIMMSQNRQEAKDRLRSQHDYQINLKAELEIRHLHEKVDHLLSHQWQRLVEIQQIQIELLSELAKR